MFSNKVIIILILVLFITTFATLDHISIFMDSEKKCESSFAVINRCGCIPDENMAKLFNQKYIPPLNINSAEYGNK